MKAVIVYDSQYGNTQHIAEAIATALSHYEDVQTLTVQDATNIDWRGVKLLIVGGPTQAHTMSKRLHAWLDALPPGILTGIHAGAFDTRYHGMKLLTGAAAPPIARRLKELGAEVLLPPESFYVVGGEGPLADGELERASRWALLTPAGVQEE